MIEREHRTVHGITAIQKVLSAQSQTIVGKEKLGMTRLIRTVTFACLLFGLLVHAPGSSAQTRPPILKQIAETYGLDSFGNIDAIRYTWNVEIPGLFKAAHKWEWEPKTGKISYEGTDKAGKPVKAGFVESQLNSAPASIKDEIAPSFVNDNYWLLFSLHAYWDTSATVTDQGKRKLPIGPATAELVVVKYPAEAGGYTPGDTWDLYVGADKRVQQFVYHRLGAKKPNLVIASWADYKKAGPLLVAMDHRGTADGKPLHIFISDLSVKMHGSDTWTKAK